MFGGGDTTANAIMIGAFYLLKNPEILANLKKELGEAWPRISDEPELKELERLPYLVCVLVSAFDVSLAEEAQNAVIKESLRIGPGIPGGLPRIVPANGAKIDGHYVPGGVSKGSPLDDEWALREERAHTDNRFDRQLVRTPQCVYLRQAR